MPSLLQGGIQDCEHLLASQSCLLALQIGKKILVANLTMWCHCVEDIVTKKLEGKAWIEIVGEHVRW